MSYPKAVPSSLETGQFLSLVQMYMNVQTHKKDNVSHTNLVERLGKYLLCLKQPTRNEWWSLRRKELKKKKIYILN